MLDLTFTPLQGTVLAEALPLLGPQSPLLNQGCQGFAAQYGGKCVGVTLFRPHGPYFVMEHIFVDPRFRRMGVGHQLLRTLCTLAQTRQKELLFSFEADGIGHGFYRFVASTRLFSIRRQEGTVFVAPPEAIQAFLAQHPPKGEASPLFFQQSHLLRKEFLSHLEAQYPEIAWELRGNDAAYQDALCRCVVSGEQIQAVCLIQEFEHERELKLLYARPGKGVLSAKVLLSALWALGERPAMPLRFAPVGEAAMKLAENLCPSRRSESPIYTAYFTGTLTTGGVSNGI